MVFSMIVVSGRAMAVAEGDFMPEVTINGHGGVAPISVEQMKGKVTMLNFWATWCAACKVEIKEMENEYTDLFKNAKFQMAFVSLDKNPEDSLNWLKGNVGNPEVLEKYLFQDSEFKVADTLAVDAFPMTVVIGPDLKILKIQKGFEEGKGTTKALSDSAFGALKSL
jgi:thiol-disulfide isomerase/thioredoxin